MESKLKMHAAESARGPGSAIAFALCDDLCKKLRQVGKMEEQFRKRVFAGLVDGMTEAAIPHPYGDMIPPIRPAMDTGYVAGYEVAETWARIAKEWPLALAMGELDLLPCPYCGSAAEITDESQPDNPLSWFFARCKNHTECNSWLAAASPAKVAAKWNRRSLPNQDSNAAGSI